MTKCPHCGYESPRADKPSPPKAEYEYTGYWRVYLPEILELLRKGYKPDRVVDVLAMRYMAKSFAERLAFPHRPSKLMVSYIGRRYGIIPPAIVKPKINYKQRDIEITRRYLAGAEYAELAKTYGIRIERVRYIVGWEIFTKLYNQNPNMEWVEERQEELRAARWIAKCSKTAELTRS